MEAYMPNQVTVYQADAHGFYLHPVVANELPLSPGTYNVPYGAQLQPPPEAPIGMVARAVADEWELVEDHRAETLYRTDTGDQYDLGTTLQLGGEAVRYVGAGPIPNWLTTEAPPAPGSTWNGEGWDAPPIDDGIEASAP